MIALIGFTGCGKSTIGRMLATTHGFVTYDVDAEIERKSEKSIRDIFATQGEAAFREMESQAIDRIVMNAKARHAVIVTGAGAVIREQNRALLASSCITFHIDTPLEIVMARLVGDQQRPLIQGPDRIKTMMSLYESRKEFYKFAKYRIEQPDGRSAVASLLAKLMMHEMV